jgi:hypothetical protein
MSSIIAALATWQIVEIWHHSLLTAPLRVRTEMWTNKLGELLSCPFCLSIWVALLCVVVLSLEEYGLAGQCGSVVIHAFAVSRLANLGNDFFKQHSLTSKATLDYEHLDDPESGDSIG